MEEKNKLTREELKKVSGGYWEYGTLSDEEEARLYELYNDWWYSVMQLQEDPQKATALVDYVSELEKKYGPSDFANEMRMWPGK